MQTIYREIPRHHWQRRHDGGDHGRPPEPFGYQAYEQSAADHSDQRGCYQIEATESQEPANEPARQPPQSAQRDDRKAPVVKKREGSRTERPGGRKKCNPQRIRQRERRADLEGEDRSVNPTPRQSATITARVKPRRAVPMVT